MVVAALTIGLTQAVADAAPVPAATPHVATGGASDFGTAAAQSPDLALDGFGDSAGYHLQEATEKSGFAWAQVAILKPAGLDDRSWTGYQCLSGDGKYAAVTVLPVSAVNTIAARDHGAFAFSVDLASGRVTPVARGVALQYHSPGCGVGHDAVFTVSLGANEQTTEMLQVDLATGKVGLTAKVAGQVTSVVPAEGALVGVLGSDLVRIGRDGKLGKLAAVDGIPFQLRAAADGGVDLVDLPAPNTSPAKALHEQSGHLAEFAHGDRGSLQLFTGRAGHTVVVGAAAGAQAGSRVLTSPHGLSDGVVTASLDGDALVTAHGAEGTPVLLSTKTGKVVTRQRASTGGSVSTVVPTLVPDGVAGDQRTQVSAGRAEPKGDAAAASTTAAAPQTTTAQTPKCAVPRLAENRQVMQPSPAQIDWASQMAEQNLLTAANGYSRPAGFANLGLAAYAPNDNFPKIALSHPAGDGWDTVPRSVFDAIMAQESNWNQASWHALPGMASDPLIADYYGAGGGITSINYAGADCGYGIGQATTGMDAASTGQILSVNGQTKVAVDYQENIAYALQILQTTWNKLYTAGIIANDGSPRYVENWYYAAWAYNSGIQPRDASFGNTTGCTPGPTCTGPDGTWGLGWANNPQNPVYPPNRAPYLKNTYADAAHPASWPYQERILGWTGSPLLRGGQPAYAKPTYRSGNTWLQIPPFSSFCTPVGNKCQPGTVNPTTPDAGACTLSDYECWWHNPVTWIANCTQTCAVSSYTTSGGSEPAGSDPWPPSCQVDYSKLAGGTGPAIIVDEAQSSPALNLQGCTNPNWSQGGTFKYTYGTNAAGDPIGAIDTHQLGAGLGGHILFTHTETGSDPTIINTGRWTPNLPSGAQNYKIKLHIPAIGATATNVVYKIFPGGGVAPWQFRVNQDWESEQWVTIATVAMQPGGYVEMSNQSPTVGGTNAVDYSSFDVGYDAIAFLPMGAGAVVGGPPSVLDAPKGSNPAFVNCGCVRRTAGDPVDTSTGYFGDTFTDLSTPGRLSMSLTRSYAESVADPAGPNGSLAVDGPFGYGWTFNYNSTATTDSATGNVTILQEDGSRVPFLTQTGGGFAPSAPRYDATLTKSGTTYTYTRRGKDIFTFDVATGRLLSETDVAGTKASPPYAITFGYDTGGHLTTITDPASRHYTLTWSGNHITGVSDTAGRQISYGYDTQGNLTDVYGVGTTRTPTLKDDDHMQYGYQGAHLMTSMRTPKNYGVTATPAPVTSMTYDSAERVLTQTDSLGHTTTFTYAPDGGLSAGQVLVTDPAGHKDLQTYTNGLLASETKGFGGPDAGTWTYTYDPATLGVSSITDPLGNLQTFAYDDHGNKISSSDARGFATNYQYDDHGNLISTTTPQGVRTTSNIDEAGHIAVPGGGTNAGGFAYGDVTSVTTTQLAPSSEIVNSGPDALPSRTVSYFYDDAAHPADRTRTVDVAGNTSLATFDAFGDMVTATNPLGDKAMMGYDTATGRVTTTVSPEGVLAGVVPGCTPPAKGCVRTEYDLHGDVLKTTDPLGHNETSTYGADGEKLTDTDANGKTTTTAYDAAGQVISVTRADGTVVKTDYNPDGTVADNLDAAGNKTTYTYDTRGRVVTRTNPDGQTWKAGYDTAGNPVTATDPTGRVTTETFDASGQLTGVSYSDGQTPAVSYVRDSVGQQVSMTDATGTSRWTYDAFGEVTNATDGSGAVLTYSYDKAGRAAGVTYPGGAGQTVTRTFDAASRLTGITDWNNNTTKFDYGHDGQQVSTTYPNGTKVSHTYDNTDQLGSTTLTGAGNAVLASLTYTRDPANQVATQTPTGLPDGQQTYTYGAREQLASVTAAGATSQYALDAVGNPTIVGGAQQVFDAAGQLCWTASSAVANPTCNSPPTGAATFTFDGLGERTKTVQGASTSTYTYDQANRLATATTPAGNASYRYNGVGLRTGKTVGSTSTSFTWDGENLIGDGTTSYIYGPGGLPIEQIGTNGTFWYFHDQLGDTRALVNASGQIAGTYAYTPYGTVSAHTGTSTPLQYGQGYTDAETGFVYLKSRYYDPATAEFLTVDPALDSTAEPYTYALGNPLNANDPNGQWSMFGAIVGAVIGAVVGVALVASVVMTGGLDLPLVAPVFAAGAMALVGYYAGGVMGPPTPMSMPKIRINTGRDDEPTPQTKPTGGPTGVPRPPAPRSDEDEKVSIFKAPQRGMGQCMWDHGFQPAQFKSETSNGFAYFTRDRSVADEYAESYGEGVIEVIMTKRDFDREFARYEQPYQGGPRTELEIPINSVSALNKYPKHWWK